MPGKITLEEFQKMLDDPAFPDAEIAKYLKPASQFGGFDPAFVPNPDCVEMGREESGMAIGNWICRKRRRARFKRRVKQGENLPVLVSEGDSWFQFPFLIDEVIDNLNDDFLIWSSGAAGDTARNMIFDNPEYMEALDEQADHVGAFLFSAAGNDVIGEDENGDPVLEKLLHQRSGSKKAALKLINKSELNRVLTKLREGYLKVIRDIRSDARFDDLPIVIHGYDYAIPYPAGPGDQRNPIYAANDKWLGAPMSAKGIDDPLVRREIVEILINELYDLLGKVAATDPHVHLVNIRGTLTQVSDWKDEIHGTSEGFQRVAARFRKVLNKVVKDRPGITGNAESNVVQDDIEIEIKDLSVLKRKMREVDPSVLGFGDIEKFASGFLRTGKRISSRATPEIAIGEDDSLPYRFLLRGVEAGKAVCKIMCEGTNFRGQTGRWNGTGFLVGPNLLLTNHHVVNSRAVAASARAVFDYHENKPGVMAASSVFSLDPDRLLISSPFEELDYSFVWINGNPQDRFGTVPFWRGSFMAGPRATANIVQHPQGLPKRTSIKRNEVVDLGFNDVLIHYASDTEPGSSGSPVFNDYWRLVALHHASSAKLHPDVARRVNGETGHETPVLNEGIKTSAIAIDIDRRAEHGADRSTARQVQAHLAGTDSRTGFFGTLGRDSRGTGVEAVVDTYLGAPGDIDIAFWNVEWFNRHYEDKADDVARIVADLNLDIWAFEETSPQATEFLVNRLRNAFDLEFDFAASEPEASSGKQTTTVIWNRKTVSGKRLDWPDDIHKLLKLRSDDPEASRFEAVEGQIFNRYPGLFRFEALHTELGEQAFDFNLVPVHLKAKAEGSKRRRMASNVLATAVAMTAGTHVAENDWVIGGDFNAELATGAFEPLSRAGFRAMSAADEKGGAITYLARNFRSLIDSIFLSPGLQTRAGSDDFMIIARDNLDPGFIDRVSDHRPVMVRLSTAEEPKAGLGADLPSYDAASAENRAFLDVFAEEVSRDPAGVLSELAKKFRDA